MKIEAKTFSLPETYNGKLTLETMNEHVGLYNGYIKHTNLILEKLSLYSTDPAEHIYEIGELSRRFAFEYNGIKNHESYFQQLESGSTAIDTNSKLYMLIVEVFGSWGEWMNQFRLLAKTRGVGWAVLWYDIEKNALYNSWVDEQHFGQLNGCTFVYGIDLWEHSYVHDYLPSGKAAYIDDYIANTNWSIVANRIH